MDLLTEGMKITLLFQKNTNVVEMVCSIDKVYSDRLEISLPQYFMRYIEFLQVGQELTAKIFTKLGTIDFNTIVITSPLEDFFSIELDYNALKLTPGEEIPVVHAVEKLEVKKDEKTFTLETIELSTDYFKFVSEEPFNLEDILDCSLILPEDYGIINFRATVSEINPTYTNEYTARFSTMSEEERQALLYFMYMYSTSTN